MVSRVVAPANAVSVVNAASAVSAGAKKAAPKAVPKVTPKAVAEPAVPPVAAPAVTAAAPTPVASAPAAAAAPAGNWTVQLAAYQVLADAERLSTKMKTRGYDVRVTADRPYRVRIGRYATRAEAVTLVTKLQALQITAIVTEAEKQDAAGELTAVMLEVPVWAPGLPLACEVRGERRYAK